MNDELMELIRGSGNVFADMRQGNADAHQIKALLAAEIIKALDADGLSVRKAHARTGIAAPDFSRIRNGDLGRFTIDRLINTHHHWDHTAGNGVFQPATVKIVAHENVPGLQRAAAARQPAQPGMPGPDEQVVATVTYKDTWREDVGGETVALKYYGPAHTGGDSVVTFEKANVVHMGDLVFNRRHPFIDRPGGASIAGWIKVLEGTMADHGADTIYVFGHAGPQWPVTGARADLAYMRDYLAALVDHVRAEMKAGKPRDAIVKATEPLKGFSDHGPLIERVLTAAYEELAPQP